MDATKFKFITPEKELCKEIRSMTNSLYKRLYSEKAKNGWVIRRNRKTQKEQFILNKTTKRNT